MTCSGDEKKSRNVWCISEYLHLSHQDLLFTELTRHLCCQRQRFAHLTALFPCCLEWYQMLLPARLDGSIEHVLHRVPELVTQVGEFLGGEVHPFDLFIDPFEPASVRSCCLNRGFS